MDDDERLRGATDWQLKPRRSASRLGDEITAYLKQHHRQFEKNASIIDIWRHVVPPALQDYCKPDKRVGNTLYVQVMPGAYMHRIQTMAGELTERIKQLSPRCGIQKIKITPMRQSTEEL
jgi:hypothetical protein